MIDFKNRNTILVCFNYEKIQPSDKSPLILGLGVFFIRFILLLYLKDEEVQMKDEHLKTRALQADVCCPFKGRSLQQK